MALIDTSAWVEYLRATGSPVDGMTEALLYEDAFTTDVVVAEVLLGARDDRHAEDLRRMLNRCHFVPTRPLFDFERAAEIYRTCRRGGFTPRSLIDCLVAAVAIDRRLPLLHHDQDFVGIAAHTPLALVG
ncbi:MAG: PIN domain nuclease [Actinobacteria bacterium]|nr:PIN domain nuclease [Actinomycetota bacterium]